MSVHISTIYSINILEKGPSTTADTIFVVGPTKLLFSIKIKHGMMLFFYNSNYYYPPLTFSSIFSMLKEC